METGSSAKRGGGRGDKDGREISGESKKQEVFLSFQFRPFETAAHMIDRDIYLLQFSWDHHHLVNDPWPVGGHCWHCEGCILILRQSQRQGDID